MRLMRPRAGDLARRLVVVSAMGIVIAACDRTPAARPDTTGTTPSTTADSGAATAPVLSDRGYGPLRVGMTVSEAIAATSGALSMPSTTMPGQCVYATWSDAPRGLRVMFEDEVLARIDVTEAGTRSAEGLEVGASGARADSLYGRAVHGPHKYEAGEYLTVRFPAPADSGTRLVIEVVGSRVRAFRVGRVPAVEYVEGCS